MIDFDRTPLLDRAREFRDSTDSDEDPCRRLGIRLKKGWSVPNARRLIREVSDLGAHIHPVLYRPVDHRLIFYHDSLVWRTVKKIMGHMLHLLESPALDHPLTDYAGRKAPTVGRVGWSNGTVWLDAARRNARERHRATRPGQYGFHGVREEVWEFQVGGYHVCHKWLKDRKGRALSDADIAHYQKIVVALSETITIMDAIDGVIGHFGGWPTAFEDEAGPTRKPPSLARAAESGPRYDAGRTTRESDR